MDDFNPAVDGPEVECRMATIVADRIRGLDPEDQERLKAATSRTTIVEPLGPSWLRLYVQADEQVIELGHVHRAAFSAVHLTPN